MVLREPRRCHGASDIYFIFDRQVWAVNSASADDKFEWHCRGLVGLVKPPRRDTRALSPAGMIGGKAPLRLAAQKSRPHAPSVPMRSAPAYFLCKWGV